MNAEDLSLAIGNIDDSLIEAADNLRGKKVKSHRGRWTAMAACFCLIVVAAAAFLGGFPIIGGKSGGNPGVFAGGSYYYKTDFNFYKYTDGQRERVMSTFFIQSGWKVDDYGLYYVKGQTLYVREHETGKSHRLYKADTKIWIRCLENGQITIWLRDKNKLSGDLQSYVCVDGKTREIVWQKSLSWEEEWAIMSSGNIYGEYPVGGYVFKEVLTDGRYDLYLDGEPFLPEGQYGEFRLEYYGENLVIRYQDIRVSRGKPEYLLVKPDGEIAELPEGWYLAGTSDILLFVDDAWLSTPYDLYGYDVKTGEAVLLCENADVYYAVTDGEWLFTSVPWAGRTDCWKLIYDENGELAGLELRASDI